MTTTMLVVFVIATYRLTHMILADTITYWLRKPFFNLVTIDGEDFLAPKPKLKYLAELFSCFWCMSIWVGAALLTLYHFYPTVAEYIYYILTASAVAVFLHKVMSQYE